MGQTKHIQLYRNETVVLPNTISNKTALTVAKETIEVYGSKIDGEITLIRYREKDNDPVKTLAGIYHDDGNDGSWTYLIEIDETQFCTKDEMNETEEVVAQALSELDGRVTLNTSNVSSQEDDIEALALYLQDVDDRLDAEIEERVIQIVNVTTSGNITQSLDPNKFYIFTNPATSLTLTLNSGNGLCVYTGKFTASSSGCSVVLPQTVTVADAAPSIEGGSTYEFSIADNVLIYIKV